MEEMVKITLGEYKITVDKSTADRLESDPDFLQKYYAQLQEVIGNNKSKVIESEQMKLAESKVWTTSRTQTTRDKSATEYFIQLRKELDNKFMDKTTSKIFLWTEISLKMNEAGFFVGEGTEGREKCRQKFVNLQSSYMKYMDRKRTTGEGKIEKPPYYDNLDEILGNKDKTQPVLLIDSTILTSTGISSASPLSIANDCSQPSTSKISCTSLSSIANDCSQPSISKGTFSNRFTGESIKSSVTPKKMRCWKSFMF